MDELLLQKASRNMFNVAALLQTDSVLNSLREIRRIRSRLKAD